MAIFRMFVFYALVGIIFHSQPLHATISIEAEASNVEDAVSDPCDLPLLFYLYPWMNRFNPNTCSVSYIVQMERENDFIFFFQYNHGGFQFFDVEGESLCGGSASVYPQCQEQLGVTVGDEIWNCRDGFTPCDNNYSADDIFNILPWLNDVVPDRRNCGSTSITAYISGNTFVYFSIEDKLYSHDGSLFCTSSPTLDCVDFYNLERSTLIWSCNSNACGCTDIEDTVYDAEGNPYQNPCIAACLGVEAESYDEVYTVCRGDTLNLTAEIVSIPYSCPSCGEPTAPPSKYVTWTPFGDCRNCEETTITPTITTSYVAESGYSDCFGGDPFCPQGPEGPKVYTKILVIVDQTCGIPKTVDCENPVDAEEIVQRFTQRNAGELDPQYGYSVIEHFGEDSGYFYEISNLCPFDVDPDNADDSPFIGYYVSCEGEIICWYGRPNSPSCSTIDNEENTPIDMTLSTFSIRKLVVECTRDPISVTVCSGDTQTSIPIDAPVLPQGEGFPQSYDCLSVPNVQVVQFNYISASPTELVISSTPEPFYRVIINGGQECNTRVYEFDITVENCGGEGINCNTRANPQAVLDAFMQNRPGEIDLQYGIEILEHFGPEVGYFYELVNRCPYLTNPQVSGDLPFKGYYVSCAGELICWYGNDVPPSCSTIKNDKNEPIDMTLSTRAEIAYVQECTNNPLVVVGCGDAPVSLPIKPNTVPFGPGFPEDYNCPNYTVEVSINTIISQNDTEVIVEPIPFGTAYEVNIITGGGCPDRMYKYLYLRDPLCLEPGELDPIFEEVPWFLNIIRDPFNCTDEYISQYTSGIHTYYLVAANGREILYTSSGNVLCENQSGYDCPSLYNLGAGEVIWSCTDSNDGCDTHIPTEQLEATLGLSSNPLLGYVILEHYGPEIGYFYEVTNYCPNEIAGTGSVDFVNTFYTCFGEEICTVGGFSAPCFPNQYDMDLTLATSTKVVATAHCNTDGRIDTVCEGDRVQIGIGPNPGGPSGPQCCIPTTYECLDQPIIVIQPPAPFYREGDKYFIEPTREGIYTVEFYYGPDCAPKSYVHTINFDPSCNNTPDCSKNSGTIFFENCDDGTLYFFIESDNGQIFDPYFDDGISFNVNDATRVNFDYIDANFDSPCSIAEKAITITCIEEADPPPPSEDIFNMYPEILDVFDPFTCSTGQDKIDVYMSGASTFILVTLPSNSTILYLLQNGQLNYWCQDTPHTTCTVSYNLSDPIASWNCGSPQPQGPGNDVFSNYTWLNDLIDVENCNGRSVDVYFQGGVYYTLVAGQVYLSDGSPVDILTLDPSKIIYTWSCSTIRPCQGDRILLGSEVRLNHPLGQLQNPCPQGPEGSPPAIECACSMVTSLDIFPKDDIQEFEPENGSFIATATESKSYNIIGRTSALNPENFCRSVQIERIINVQIMVEDCGPTELDPIYDTFPWLINVVDPNNCASEIVEVYDHGSYSFVFVNTGGGFGTLYFGDGTVYCNETPTYNCKEFYGLTGATDIYICGDTGCNCTQEYDPVCGVDGMIYSNGCVAACAGVDIAYVGECITAESHPYFTTYPWLGDIVSTAPCEDGTFIAEIQKNGQTYIVVETEYGAQTQLYTGGGVFLCMDFPNYSCVDLYQLTGIEFSSIECLPDGNWGDSSDIGGEDDIFAEFTWVQDIVDPTSCNGEIVADYGDLIFIWDGNVESLYDLDGNRVCRSSACLSAYDLLDPVTVWTCSQGVEIYEICAGDVVALNYPDMLAQGPQGAGCSPPSCTNVTATAVYPEQDAILDPLQGGVTLSPSATNIYIYDRIATTGGGPSNPGCPGGCMPQGVENIIVVKVEQCINDSEIDSRSQPTTDLDFAVFPNPGNGLVQIRLEQAIDQDMILKAYDVVGNEITTLNILNGDTDARIDLTSAPNGLYFISVQSDKDTYVKRYIKQ